MCKAIMQGANYRFAFSSLLPALLVVGTFD
jgi:hypothetical protein